MFLTPATCNPKKGPLREEGTIPKKMEQTSTYDHLPMHTRIRTYAERDIHIKLQHRALLGKAMQVPRGTYWLTYVLTTCTVHRDLLGGPCRYPRHVIDTPMCGL